MVCRIIAGARNSMGGIGYRVLNHISFSILIVNHDTAFFNIVIIGV